MAGELSELYNNSTRITINNKGTLIYNIKTSGSIIGRVVNSVRQLSNKDRNAILIIATITKKINDNFSAKDKQSISEPNFTKSEQKIRFGQILF